MLFRKLYKNQIFAQLTWINTGEKEGGALI